MEKELKSNGFFTMKGMNNIKVALGRTMWNVVDVVVAIGLVALWLREHQTVDIK